MSPQSEKLDAIRMRIDACDDAIMRLLNERAELVMQVRDTKAKERIEVYSPLREKQILDRVQHLAEQGTFPKDAAQNIFRSIISASRSLVGELIVSYLGPEGGSAHQAAVKQFGESVHGTAEESIEDILHRVKSGESHFGVVLGRSAEAGSISRVFDLLAKSGLSVIGQVHVRAASVLSGRERADFVYFVVGTKCPPPSGNDKTLLILRVKERAGGLRDILRPFSERGITLFSLESRSSSQTEGEYSFYLEFPGHQQDSLIEELIQELQNQCQSVSVLGSYPEGGA